MSISEVIDSSFYDEVIKVKGPVLVDFWAPWCGPCRMIGPIIDEIAQEYENQLKVVKINTDQNPNTATTYGIRSIPTIMIFSSGEKVDMVIGAVPKTTLITRLEKYI